MARPFGIRRGLFHLALAGLLTGLYLAGVFEGLENKLIDARYTMIERAAHQNVVVVHIDSRSLRQVGVWPWPRSIHADLLERLFAAGATTVALDIDFSSPSNDHDDTALEQALRRYRGRVILPIFVQLSGIADSERSVEMTAPLARFQKHVTTASVNIQPDRDGIVRQMSIAEPWEDGHAFTLPTVLAEPGVSVPDTYYIDFGIGAQTLPQLSYVEVLQGTFDPAIVAGKVVIVGASALELGDIVTVPVWKALPGVVVQALAVQSLDQDRALRRLAPPLIVLGIFALVLAFGPTCARLPSRPGLLVALGSIAAIMAGAAAMQGAFPLIVDVVPWMCSVALCYGTGLLHRINEQDLRLLAQKLALVRKDEQMRLVVENTFDAIVTVSETGAVQSFNRAARQIFGYASDEVLGQDFALLLGKAPGDTVPGLAGLSETAEPRELVGRRKSGDTFAIDCAVTDVVDDGTRRYIALIRDISARKHAEAIAAQAQQRLLQAIESVSEAFVLWDHEDRLVLCNGNFRALHPGIEDLLKPGWSFEDIAAANATVADLPAARGRLQEWLQDRLRAHRHPAGAFEQQTADGRWLRVSERKTGDGGIVGIVSDVTAEKRYAEALRSAKEQAEAANRAKTEFLANMSHELRTPLNAVIGFSEIIKDEMLGAVGKQEYLSYAEDIHGSGQHLLQVINDILDVSRIEMGNLALNEDWMDLREVVTSCGRLIAERAKRAGVELTVHCDQRLPALHGDERLVKQTLINHLSNAVKFTQNGGTVRLQATAAAGGGLTVSVTDTGIGMREEDIPRALAPFGQVDSSLAREYEGTGLGLPLAKSFVELHGGSLDIESRPGIGTTVTVRFPAERVREIGQPASQKRLA
jgi:PAS domain S-box-containing protein